ncbi:MAG: hypothetical protein HMLIMOIP_000376 [Candidatus Nitrosomirales archaeon]|jgi:hypothetical protein
MQLNEWLKQYDVLRIKFGYSVVEDQNAARFLSELLEGKCVDLETLSNLISNKNVLVVGAGPSLEDNLSKLSSLKQFTIIAADGASQALLENNIKPDIVVTDLDGSHEHLLQANKMGSIMVVHAHGDNVDLMRNLVPKMKNCIGTTQVKPLHNVYNFGGFTDGDRAVFLASEFGANNIILVGMDFGEKIGRYSKTKVKDEKLKIAKMAVGKQLLEWLSTFSASKLYNASPSTINGFKNISLEEIPAIT